MTKDKNKKRIIVEGNSPVKKLNRKCQYPGCLGIAVSIKETKFLCLEHFNQIKRNKRIENIERRHLRLCGTRKRKLNCI